MKDSTEQKIKENLVLIVNVPERASTLEDYEIGELRSYMEEATHKILTHSARSPVFIDCLDAELILDQIYKGDYDRFELDGFKAVEKAINKFSDKAKQGAKNEASEIEDISVLNTPEAIAIINKAIEAGLISPNGKGYKWEGTRPQLALFAVKASEQLKLKSKYKCFELLFGKKNLAQDWFKSMSVMGTVKDEDKIYRLFD